MPDKYVAFLRAINVAGRFVKMPVLRQLFEEMGFAGVSTFIASGNVIFTAEGEQAYGHEDLIEQGLQMGLGFEVPTFVRSAGELSKSVSRALEIEKADLGPDGQLLVGFLREPPDAVARSRLAELAGEGNSFRVEGRELYWTTGGRISDSGISGKQIENRLGMLTTTRNMRTLRRLAEKMSQP